MNMTCFNPKYIYIKPKWELSVKDEYLQYKEQKRKKPDTPVPYEINQLKNTFRPRLDYYEMQIPCGRCIGCRLDHAGDWATRIWAETKTWKDNCFVTLTYNNEHLPKNETLVKKDVQDFFKRLLYHEEGREYWVNPITEKTEKPIRRFYCGEYGPKGGRPHYHTAIFNYKPKDLKLYKQNRSGDNLYTSKSLQEIWGKGFVIIGDLTYQSASYIAR